MARRREQAILRIKYGLCKPEEPMADNLSDVHGDAVLDGEAGEEINVNRYRIDLQTHEHAGRTPMEV